MNNVVLTVCLALVTCSLAVTGADVRAPQAAERPATTQRTADDAIKARVQSALLSASDVPGRDLAVDVKSGVVMLSGKVASGTEQQSVGAIVRAVPGVKEVRFSLRIEPPVQPAGRGAAPGGRGAGPGGRGAAPQIP